MNWFTSLIHDVELKSGDVEAFMERLKIFFSGIPYELSDDTERHYQVIFHVVFTLLGQFIRSEVRSSRGRADAVVHTPTAIYVFEFKLDGTADAALKQIDEKVSDSLYIGWQEISESGCELQ